MDLNGASDPYVMFFTDPDVTGTTPADSSGCVLCNRGKEIKPKRFVFLFIPRRAVSPKAQSVLKSTVKQRSLNPSWLESEIPRIPLRVQSSAQLRRCHLFAVVMDRDVAGDDRMGERAYRF